MRSLYIPLDSVGWQNHWMVISRFPILWNYFRYGIWLIRTIRVVVVRCLWYQFSFSVTVLSRWINIADNEYWSDHKLIEINRILAMGAISLKLIRLPFWRHIFNNQSSNISPFHVTADCSLWWIWPMHPRHSDVLALCSSTISTWFHTNIILFHRTPDQEL
jgi:hypothetical protein